MMRGWDVVSSSSKSFFLIRDGVQNECVMKVGSAYSVTSFASMLTETIKKVSPGFTVLYDKISNRYSFVPPDDKAYIIAFTHRHQLVLFGFPIDTQKTRVFKKTDPLTSPNNVSMSPQVAVVIRTNLPTAEVFDNFQKPHPINTGVLLVVPIDCPPFGELQYQCMTPDTGTLHLLTEHVHSIQLVITDEGGDLLDCGDFVLGLRFDIYPPTSPF
jgi:hypothetical protein